MQSIRDVDHRSRQWFRVISAIGGVAALLAVNLAIPPAAAAEPTCTYKTETVREWIDGDPPYPKSRDVVSSDCTTTVEVPTTTTETTTATETTTSTETTTTTETTTETTTVEVPGELATTVTTTVEVPVTVPTTVEVPVAVPTTVGVPTTVEIPTTLSDQQGEQTTVFETVINGVPTTVTELSNSVVQQTWAFASEVNPATNQVPALSLSAYDVQPGQSLTVSVEGFTPGETVQIWMNSEPVLLGEATADQAGTASQVVTIPADAVAGLHTIRVVGVTCGIDASVPIRVSPAAAPSDSADAQTDFAAPFDPYRRLSSTGFDAGSSVWLGVALLLAGLGAMLLGRRFGLRSVTSTNVASTDVATTDVASTDVVSTDLALTDFASTDFASTDIDPPAGDRTDGGPTEVIPPTVIPTDDEPAGRDSVG